MGIPNKVPQYTSKTKANLESFTDAVFESPKLKQEDSKGTLLGQSDNIIEYGLKQLFNSVSKLRK